MSDSLNLLSASFDDYRREAKKRLPRFLFDYIDGGSGAEVTLARNTADWESIQVIQKVLHDATHLDCSVELFGEKLAMPLVLAPVGMGGMTARRGEVQAKRAADAAGIPFCLSTVGVCSLEEVGQVSDRPFWFQLYMLKDRGVVKEILDRAWDQGVRTLAFTIDLAQLGTRYRDIRNGMTGGLGAWGKLRSGFIDFALHPRWAFDVGLFGQWRERTQPSYGAWLNLPDLYSAEMIARMGFDWICFDLQHGLMSYSHLLALIPAVAGSGATTLVRVTTNDAGQIGRALDAGAHGVIVPMVNTAEEAARAVAACRYPPQGVRSCGPMRDAMLEGFEYLATANAEIACIAMIETREGLANVEAIAATPGLDGLFIGPMDLCYGLGIAPGSFGDPAYVEAVERIKQACQDAGIAAGMFGYNAEMSRTSLTSGFQFSSIGSDANFLRDGAKCAFDAARGLDQAGAAKGQPGY